MNIDRVMKNLLCATGFVWPLGGCVGPQGGSNPAYLFVVEEKLKVGQEQQFLLVPGHPSFVVARGEGLKSRVIAEVQVSQASGDASGILNEDSERTGIRVLNVKSEPFLMEEFEAQTPRVSWRGSIYRNSSNEGDAPLLKDAEFTIKRLFQSSSDRARSAGCELVLFGNSERLYAVGNRPFTIRLVMVLEGVRTKAQADALKNGLCIVPEAAPFLSNNNLVQVGYVTTGGRRHRITWVVQETLEPGYTRD